jgi:hypothetical protein
MQLGIGALLTRGVRGDGGVLLCERHFDSRVKMRRMMAPGAWKNKGPRERPL